MLTYNLPSLVLGGGGYTIKNVSRCWTYETAVVLGDEVADDLPYNDYYEYAGHRTLLTRTLARTMSCRTTTTTSTTRSPSPSRSRSPSPSPCP